METQQSPAEELPALYRAVLDGVAELERRGERREAGLVRDQATRVYSWAWDAGGRRQLIELRRRVERIIADRERPRADRSSRLAFRRSNAGR